VDLSELVGIDDVKDDLVRNTAQFVDDLAGRLRMAGR